MLTWIKQLYGRLWFRAFLFIGAYLLAALLSREVSFQGASFPTIWFPSGLFVAVLLLSDIANWPVYLLAALPASLTFTLLSYQSLPIGALLYIVGVLEAATAAWLIRRFDRQAGRFTSSTNVFSLVLFACLVGSALAATIYTTVLATLNSSVGYWATWRIIWISHGLGSLITASLILSWASTRLAGRKKIQPERVIELAILISGLAVCCLYVFVGTFSLNKFSYLVVPFLVWVALRFGPRSVTLCGAVVTIVACWGTAQQLSGFAINDSTIAPNMEALGGFLAVTLITCYLVAAIWEQSKVIQQALRESEARYRLLIENQGEGVGIVDANEVFTFANPAALQIFGTQQLVGKSLKEFSTPDQYELILSQTQLRKVGQRSSYELEINQPGGKRCSLWVVASPEISSDGNYQGCFSVFHDITEQKQVEMALRDSRARFQTLFDHSPIAIWEEDFSRIKRYLTSLQREGVDDLHEFFHQHPEQVSACAQLIRVLDANRAAIQLQGYADKALFLAQSQSLINRGPNDVFLEELMAIAEGKTEFETEGPNDLIDGVIRHHHVRWTVAPGYEANYRRVIVSIMDVTERKQAEEHMRYLSTHDVLTGLYNRNLFEAEMERMQDSRLEPINVMVADVNGMKATNDTYGHAAGDELLRRTAQVLRMSFRKEDIIARIGGDEFVVLFYGSISTQDAVNRVKDCLVDHNHWYDGTALSLAIGAASGGKGSSLVELFKRADYLMYKDKMRSRKTRAESRPDGRSGNSPQNV